MKLKILKYKIKNKLLVIQPFFIIREQGDDCKLKINILRNDFADKCNSSYFLSLSGCINLSSNKKQDHYSNLNLKDLKKYKQFFNSLKRKSILNKYYCPDINEIIIST